MIKETIKELVGQPNIIDLIVCTAGVLVFAVWLLKTSLGAKALVDSPSRRNNMPPYLALIPFFFWAFSVLILDWVKKKTAPQLSGWQDAFAGNLALCLGAAPAIVTIVYIARRHFARGLRGFGLNPKTILKDFPAALLNLLATMPVVWAALILTAVIGKLAAGPAFEIPKHEELKEIIVHPQWQVRAIIVFSSVFVVPVTEEFIFRGMFQTLLRSYIARPWLAIILASFIFVICHIDKLHWPALFVIGLCLGYAYEKSGSLFRCIFLHAMFNAASVFAALGASAALRWCSGDC
jgi:membrane protease YdiL (CAAX protease family)